MIDETMCRMCGNEPVDPESGSFDMCTDCYVLLDTELDDFDNWCEEIKDDGFKLDECPF